MNMLHLDGRTADALARDAAFRVQLEAAGLTVSPELAQFSRTLGRAERTTHRPRAASAVLLSPDLVGRGPALAELDAAWADTLRGKGSVVVVEAELGIGKTRLCEEFARGLAARSERAGVYAAHPRQDPGPEELAVVRRLAGALAGAPGLAGAPATALAVLARIAPAIRERFPALPEAAATAESLAEAFPECVAAVAEESPALLVVDDLPQADPASRQVLRVTGSAASARLVGPDGEEGEAFTSWRAEAVLRLDRPDGSRHEERFEPVDAYRLMVEAVAARVRGDDAFLVGLDHSARVTGTLDAIRRRL